MEDVTKYGSLFETTFKVHIKREGAEDLWNFLKNESNFLKDPASSKYHLDVPEGLIIHSLNVYKRLKWLCNQEAEHNPDFERPSDESIAIVGLLHDLCKADTYQQEVKNFKNYDKDAIKASGSIIAKQDSHGQFIWDTRLSYYKDDKLPYGHGEKSVYMISKYMKLTDEEAFAIRYHMGSWNYDEKDQASKTFKMNEFAFLAHVADEWATFVDEAK